MAASNGRFSVLIKNKYPKEIYYNGRELFFEPGKDGLAELSEDAYDIGFSDGHAARMSMDGFSSLSEAYGEGVMIDWERLEGRMARVVSSEFGGFFELRLRRNSEYSIDSIYGWLPDKNGFPAYLVNDAIMRPGDMELFIEGEVPCNALTADKLQSGTFFVGHQIGKPLREYVRYDVKGCGVVTKRVASLCSDENILAEKVEVYRTLRGGVVEV